MLWSSPFDVMDGLHEYHEDENVVNDSAGDSMANAKTRSRSSISNVTWVQTHECHMHE